MCVCVCMCIHGGAMPIDTHIIIFPAQVTSTSTVICHAHIWCHPALSCMSNIPASGKAGFQISSDQPHEGYLSCQIISPYVRGD